MSHLYPEGDYYGYYGKGLWGDFARDNEQVAEQITRLCTYMPDSTDPILSGFDHIEHKWYRIACLLGLAEWPDVPR